MAIERTVTLTDAGITVTVRELTVAEVRQWLAMMEEPGLDVVGNLLFDGITAREVAMFCGNSLDVGEMDKLKPSEMQQVIDKIKDLNPHFFKLRGQLIPAAQS